MKSRNRHRAHRVRRTSLRIETLEDRSTPATILVTPALVPTPTDNDYTRIQNAVNSAADGDTILLTGTFDFTEANAAASWALGSDGTAGTFDDYSVYVPENLTGVAMTATALGMATIQGPGDLPTLDLEGFLYFDGVGYQGWTVSNLTILDFDMGIGMFTDDSINRAFDNVTITNNRIRLASDLNGENFPNDPLQNIAIHYAYGQNQTISDNVIEIPGDGVSSATATEGDLFANPDKFATSVAIQSRNAFSDYVDELLISGNTIRVLNAQSAFPERVIGIWENTTATRSDIIVTNNQFLNDSPNNNPALNRQQGFWVTTHSNSAGLGTTVTYSNNTVSGALLAFRYTTDYDYSLDPTNTPIEFINNTLTNVSAGFLIQNNGKAHMTGNSLTGVGIGPGAGIGVLLRPGSTLNFDTTVGANTVTGFATGLEIGGTATIDGASVTGNATGIQVIAGTALIQNTDLQDNTAVGLRVQEGAIVDAGQVATVDYTPVDYTGLGISAGGNDFTSGYSPNGALAIFNANTGGIYDISGPNGIPFDLKAHGNSFGDISAAFVESVIRHDFDNSNLGYVDFASSTSSTDLGITAEFVTSPAFVDQRLTLLVKVTNFGPSSAVDVTVTANVPAGSTFFSVATSQGTGSEAGGTVTADLGTLPAGATAIVRIVVIPTTPTVLSSTATVSAVSPTDPNPLNDSATAVVNVVDTPSGVVRVSRVNGRLFLVGDAAENAVQVVTEPAVNTFRILGLGGTLVRFGAGAPAASVVVSNVFAGIGVNLHGGDDTVIIDGSGTNGFLGLGGGIAAGLTLGNDVFYGLHIAPTAGLGVAGSVGTNRVIVSESSFGAGVAINANAGNDTIRVSETNITRGLLALGGAGDDLIEVLDSTVGIRLVGNAGPGADTFSITDSHINVALVLAGSTGADLTTIARTTVIGAFLWNGGTGDDTLDISDTTFTGVFRALGATGNDTVTAIRTNFANVAIFHGGIGGTDTLDAGTLSNPVGAAQANSFAQTPIVVEFEIILT